VKNLIAMQKNPIGMREKRLIRPSRDFSSLFLTPFINHQKNFIIQLVIWGGDKRRRKERLAAIRCFSLMLIIYENFLLRNVHLAR
jgi:hypothetical protein